MPANSSLPSEFSYDRCVLCPRACGVNRTAGQRGRCGADDTVRVARVALHYWEEPPLSGESGSGAIFFSYCSLGCLYCQNRRISSAGGNKVVGKPITVEELGSAMLDLQDQGALNINLVTPTHYAPSVETALASARAKGLHLPVVWNTSGYETTSAIQHHAETGLVDVYLTDFKYASSSLGATYSQAADYPSVALAALEAMVDMVGKPQFDEYHGQERLIRGVVVRHLLLPGALEDSKRVVRLIQERFGSSVLLSLMNQYTPVLSTAAARGNEAASRILHLHPELGGTVSDAAYEELLDFADSLGIEDYFWQTGAANQESFIPEFSD